MTPTEPHDSTATAHVEIRPATMHDRPAIDAFAAHVLADTYTPLAGADYANELLTTWWGSTFDPAIEAGAVLLAVDAGHVIGLAHVGHLDGTPALWKLHIHPSRRSAGIGAALVDHVVAALPDGTTELLVEHIAANVDAARFYRRHGFARTHVEPHDDHRIATVWRSRKIRHHDGDHSDHGHDEFDWSAMASHLATWDRALAGMYADMAAWLEPRPGARVADIGSGAGGFAATLAQHITSDAHVTLVDTDADLLALARSHQPPGVQVEVVCIDLDREPVPIELVGAFDLVHASGVIHHTDDQLRTIHLLSTLLAPGGRLVIGEGGLATRFLPSECGIGEPDLEARLHTATLEWFWNEVRPAGATITNTAGWETLLNAVGLDGLETRSFLLDLPPPLSSDLRTLAAQSLASVADRVGPRLAPDDRAAIAALVDPARHDSVHHRPDVFILTARTLHVGTRTT